MRIEVAATAGSLGYRLTLDPSDRAEAERAHGAPGERGIRLAEDRWEVRFPGGLPELHPDLHAAALLAVLGPFVGRELILPFGVSEVLAEEVLRVEGIRVAPVDPALGPRTPPAGGRAGLLFSGGVDSTAAALLLPGEVPLLFLDRLPGSAQGLPPDPDLDLSWQRLQLDRMAAGTGRGHRVVDGHEGLFRPYPVWHHEMSRLAALYLADSLGLTGVDTGDVLCVRHFGGYCYGQAEGWSFHGAAGTPDPGAAGGRPAAAGDPAGHLLAAGVLGLTAWNSLAGLSSVASNRVVHHSRFRGHTASCYHVHPASSFCFRCDKCFLRLLLHHVEDGWEVPGTLFEHFLGQPRLRDLFRGPFFDWHHVWTYVFQRLRCAHPLSLALQAQAQRGPDLGLLERWYPLAAGLIPPACRDAVTRRIEQTVGVMTPGEIRVLETLSVPPLAAPPLVRDAMPPGEPPLAARLRALLRPAAGPAAPLGNLEAGSIRWAQDAPVVELHLVRRGAVGEDQPLLVLRVEVGTGDRPCWLRAGELAISHARETPPDTREKVQAAEALVRLLAGTGSP